MDPESNPSSDPAGPDPMIPPAPVFAPAPAPVPRAVRTSAPVGWVIAGMLVFWPTGLPALLASHRAAHAFGAGDTETALRESADARRWGIISVIVGAALALLSLVFVAVWFAVAIVAVSHFDEHSDRGPRWGIEQRLDGSGRSGDGQNGPARPDGQNQRVLPGQQPSQPGSRG